MTWCRTVSNECRETKTSGTNLTNHQLSSYLSIVRHVADRKHGKTSGSEYHDLVWFYFCLDERLA